MPERDDEDPSTAMHTDDSNAFGLDESDRNRLSAIGKRMLGQDEGGIGQSHTPYMWAQNKAHLRLRPLTLAYEYVDLLGHNDLENQRRAVTFVVRTAHVLSCIDYFWCL